MAVAAETDFVTAPSTPEPAGPTAAAPRPDSLEIVVEQRLHDGEGGGGGSSVTIFRVPAHVRDANKELYEPRLVSVGPYFRGRPALRAMEQHKWRYLHKLLALYPEASSADCVRAVRGVEQQARRCYSERTEIFAAAAAAAQGDSGQSQRAGACSGDFAEMLLLDGCFVLHFFISLYRGEPDELWDVGWGLPLLLSDLLLLENQIPFFVLEALFRAVSPEPEATRLSLLMLIVRVPHFKLDGSTFYKEVIAQTRVVPTQAEEIHHLLHLFYEAFVPRPEELVDSSAVVAASPPRPPSPSPLVVPSVTLLRDAGVRFEKKASPRHMFDVTFDAAKGVLLIPPMKVDYANKAQLVNLVAFEQTRRGPRRGSGSHGGEASAARLLSSYAALVGSLARSGEDVAHLQKRGVVDNLLSSDDDAATKFFQTLGDCSSLDYGNHIFAAMFRDLNQYYQSSWRRQKAKFLREHCSSPWAVLALAVAACVFCFALFKFSTTVYNLVHPHCSC